jgi:hypothetical protein
MTECSLKIHDRFRTDLGSCGKVLDFSVVSFQVWKVLEYDLGPGKPLKSPGICIK